MTAVPHIDFTQDDSVICDQLMSALTTVGFACLTNTGVWDVVRQFNFTFFSNSNTSVCHVHAGLVLTLDVGQFWRLDDVGSFFTCFIKSETLSNILYWYWPVS